MQRSSRYQHEAIISEAPWTGKRDILDFVTAMDQAFGDDEMKEALLHRHYFNTAALAALMHTSSFMLDRIYVGRCASIHPWLINAVAMMLYRADYDLMFFCSNYTGGLDYDLAMMKMAAQA